MPQRIIDVCHSPELLHLYDLSNSVVVVIDILRATSCMTTALANGVEQIIPVASLEECKALQEQGYLAAAERNGMMAEGFDLGNSPFSYMEERVKGKTIAMTTTNGTLAISRSLAAQRVMVGSFLNITYLANYLLAQPYHVLLVCAGWKGKVNLEDTLFAGAVISRLQQAFVPDTDAAYMALSLYEAHRDNLLAVVKQSQHARRLNNLDVHKDIEFCLQEDVYNVVPVLKGNSLVSAEATVS
jgi:2-phosphosulfolactate phosphatase